MSRSTSGLLAILSLFAILEFVLLPTEITKAKLLLVLIFLGFELTVWVQEFVPRLRGVRD